GQVEDASGEVVVVVGEAGVWDLVVSGDEDHTRVVDGHRVHEDEVGGGNEVVEVEHPACRRPAEGARAEEAARRADDLATCVQAERTAPFAARQDAEIAGRDAGLPQHGVLRAELSRPADDVTASVDRHRLARLVAGKRAEEFGAHARPPPYGLSAARALRVTDDVAAVIDA